MASLWSNFSTLAHSGHPARLADTVPDTLAVVVDTHGEEEETAKVPSSWEADRKTILQDIILQLAIKQSAKLNLDLFLHE